jgi:tetratricopeptide (TPR) repeat protein
MRRTDLRELVIQVLSNFGTEAKPDWSVGSGFVVGEDLVLTAAHNIGSGELLVRWPGTEEQPGEELSVSELLAGEPNLVDLALLTVPGLGGPVEPTRYGDVVMDRAAVVSDCWAIGFPRYKEQSGQAKPRRLSAHINGTIATGENMEYRSEGAGSAGRRLTLQVTNRPLDAPPIPNLIRESPWQGMSGSVVFAKGSPHHIVIGVITEHHPPGGTSQLTVVPISAIADQREPSAWWGRLGVDLTALIHLPIEPRIDGGEPDQLENLLALPLTPAGELPSVAGTDIYEIGVSPSKYVEPGGPSPPYAPRRHLDAELEDAFGRSPFVLLVGPATSGKSRTAIELLRRATPDARLIVPTADPTAPGRLARLDLPTAGDAAVLWLDDLERWLGPTGIDLKVLGHLQRRNPPIKVLATIRSKAYEDVSQTEGDAGRTARTILGRGRTVTMPWRPSPEDQAAATEQYPEEDFSERSIGEQLAAAPELERRYQNGYESNPYGWAVLQATIDWARMGLEVPIPDALLFGLWTRYLAESHPSLERTKAAFADGVSWARDPVAGNVAPLILVSGDEGPAYQVFSHLRAYADGQAGNQPVAIPRAAWDLVVGALPAEDLLSVAFAALTRREIEVAALAAARAREAADGVVKAWATLLLGDLEIQQDDPDAAKALLLEAAASEVPDVVPLAQLDLGALLVAMGDLSGARAPLESALQSDDPAVVSVAQSHLGGLLILLGEGGRARELLEAALQSEDSRAAAAAGARLGGLLANPGEAGRAAIQQKAVPAAVERMTPPSPGQTGGRPPDQVAQVARQFKNAALEPRLTRVVPMAQASLGGALIEQGELRRARELLDAAIGSGDSEISMVARANLAVLLQQEGKLDQARHELEELRAVQDVYISALSRVNLAGLMAGEGDTGQARGLLAEVIAEGHPDQAPRAAVALGDVAASEQDAAAAKAAYQLAMESDHPLWSLAARIHLAFVLAGTNDRTRARELLEDVETSEHPDQAAAAADFLGDLLAGDGDVQGATAAYERAIESGHSLWAPMARTDLALLIAKTGDGDRVRELLEPVVALGHPELTPRAADALGDILAAREEVEEAEQAYLQAIDSGHALWAPVARIDLAILLSRTGDVQRARELLDQVARSGHPDQAPRAADLLGDLLEAAGDVEAAKAAYRRVIDSGHSYWAPVARIDLAILLADDDPEEAAELLKEAIDAAVPRMAAYARLLLGLLRLDQEQRSAARELLTQAATGPHFPEIVPQAQFYLARMALEDGDLDSAAELLEALRAAADPAEQELTDTVVQYLAIVRLRQGDPATAARLLHEPGGDGDVATAFLRRAEHLIDLGEVDVAADLLEEALGGADANIAPRVAANLGVARLAQGRLDEAKDLLERALRQAEPSVESMARRYLASVLGRQGDRRAARDLLQPLAATVGDPHRPGALLLLGRLALADDRTDEAQDWFEQTVAMADEETEPEARLALGDLLLQNGKFAEARAAIKPVSWPPGDRRGAELLQAITDAEAEPPAEPRLVPRPPTPEAPRPQLPASPATQQPVVELGLPPGMLVLLGEVAVADGALQEARTWFSLTLSTADEAARTRAAAALDTWFADEVTSR